jgi:type III restriction enzyme
VDAYDLILKDKERLLSFEEPVRFIFSHSALREGWDNPNVFVICALKHSDNTISRRQEVGRGLRCPSISSGDRVDHPAIVHDVNVLTVVASESYKDFVTALQKDISDSLVCPPQGGHEGLLHRQGAQDAHRRCRSHAAIGQADLQVPAQERLHRRHRPHHRHVPRGQEGGHAGAAAPELQAHAEQVYQLIDSVFSDSQMFEISDDRRPKKNPLNANFDKQEFKELWNRINRKAAYSVDFDSGSW